MIAPEITPEEEETMKKRDFLKAGAGAAGALAALPVAAQQSGPIVQLEDGDRLGRAAR